VGLYSCSPLFATTSAHKKIRDDFPEQLKILQLDIKTLHSYSIEILPAIFGALTGDFLYRLI
jgi:hypothetical protein